ncbi:Site-specific recombinase XerD [Desulfatibacillum alkenivorans DSM 16219]|jgi:integrase|uniref:Site-specific recombinase XerD n=1 Tax=Desulfatibacillum alkenivorans DSM 16219 TaxID=1121393 RepID=A0A1M6YKF2_9BACT|nr:site-specific integrase [Desulfatibacillum alkenivorans]SHL18784.1 Site-specific recombinase XerD [Desulfatibacillum alkenivorans DSM 16219]
MSKRIKVDGYAGVYFRMADRIGGKGQEKVYYVVYKKDGKVVEAKAGRQYSDNMTPAKAARFRSNLIEQRELTPQEKRIVEQEAKDAEAVRWTLDRIWEEYKTQRPDLKGIVTDQNRYESYLQPAFGDKTPSEIQQLEVDRLRINMLTKPRKPPRFRNGKRMAKPKDGKLPPLTPQTVKNTLEILRRIINFGERKGLCEGLAFKITFPKVDNTKTEDLTPDQLRDLLDAIDKATNTEVAAIMKMALYSGMRRGELLKLQWDHIDFERGFINIVDPKGGASQKVPLNDASRTLLENRPRADSPYVFPGRGGKQRVCIRHEANKIKENAGLPKDFRALHGLRHVYASMLASSGKVDMYTLQKLLTHKSPQMTQRYAHLRDDALKQASNLAGNLIDEVVKAKEKEPEKKVEDLPKRK